MRNLDNYIFKKEDRDRIEFDQYGRPYIQDNGRMMLSIKTTYKYTIKN
jgi:hypothetical protein